MKYTYMQEHIEIGIFGNHNNSLNNKKKYYFNERNKNFKLLQSLSNFSNKNILFENSKLSKHKKIVHFVEQEIGKYQREI